MIPAIDLVNYFSISLMIKLSLLETLPLHTQIEEHIKYMIELGYWVSGSQLLSVRDFAESLGVNYNTIRAVYQALERQGYLVMRQGSGTYVSEHPPLYTSGQQLLEVLDEALFQSYSLGISTDAFVRIATIRARLFDLAAVKVRLLFVECNQADLEYHARAIAQGTRATLETALLADLYHYDPTAVARFDLIVTTMLHLNEVSTIVGPHHDVYGCVVTPSFADVLIPLSHLPKGACVGLICATKSSAEVMQRSLVGLGLTHLRLVTAGVDKQEEMQQVLHQSKHVYISRHGRSIYHIDQETAYPMHDYVTYLDINSLRTLRHRIEQIHHNFSHVQDS